jgi:CxxC motif-containing protein
MKDDRYRTRKIFDQETMTAKHKREHRKKVVQLGQPTRHYYCIVCPKGCELETDGSGVVGARCRKGEAFALQEWISPLRVLTTTIRVKDGKGRMIPVKTASPVPLTRMAELIREIKAVKVEGPVQPGDRIRVGDIEIIVTGE